MAVYCKFKSAKDYDSITIHSNFISVANLKERISVKKLGKGTDFDLIVTNADTNEEYLHEEMLIPKYTSVVVRRIPGLPRKPIVVQRNKSEIESKISDELAKSDSSRTSTTATSVVTDLEASDFDDGFGPDIYATIPKVTTGGPSSSSTQHSTPPNKVDEDSKIKAFINRSSDWQRQTTDGRVQVSGSISSGGTFGQGFGFQQRTPPQGYICHRCNIRGHFIQHCPTNGDLNFDIKKEGPPTNVLKPNEAAFEKEVEQIPCTRSIVEEVPPELHCPLCNQVMKDAVFTSKCCFKSFCDKCIRDYIISKFMCFCKAKNVLADDLVPNMTVRDTINRILESGNDSSVNKSGTGSSVVIQGNKMTLDMESAISPPSEIPSKKQKLATHAVYPQNEIKKSVDVSKANDTPLQKEIKTSGKEKMVKTPDVTQYSGTNVCWTSMQPGMNEYMGHSNFDPYYGSVIPFVDSVPYNTCHYYSGPMNMACANVMLSESFKPHNPSQSWELPGVVDDA